MSSEKEIKTVDFPWVFWISFSYRPQWFSKWWRTRGANYVEYQVWLFRITIGRPWFDGAAFGSRRDYGSYNQMRETNENNLRQPFSFLVGSRKIQKRKVVP